MKSITACIVSGGLFPPVTRMVAFMGEPSSRKSSKEDSEIEKNDSLNYWHWKIVVIGFAQIEIMSTELKKMKKNEELPEAEDSRRFMEIQQRTNAQNLMPT